MTHQNQGVIQKKSILKSHSNCVAFSFSKAHQIYPKAVQREPTREPYLSNDIQLIY
jgi:hypothetical protein